MAPAIQQVKSYLLVILDSSTSAKQAKCLLGTANAQQLRAITEIFKNLLLIPVNDKPKLKRTLKRHSYIISILSSPKIPLNHKIFVIRQSPQIVLSLIRVMKPFIVKFMSS